jgi:hypothetical protein
MMAFSRYLPPPPLPVVCRRVRNGRLHSRAPAPPMKNEEESHDSACPTQPAAHFIRASPYEFEPAPHRPVSGKSAK